MSRRWRCVGERELRRNCLRLREREIEVCGRGLSGVPGGTANEISWRALLLMGGGGGGVFPSWRTSLSLSRPAAADQHPNAPRLPDNAGRCWQARDSCPSTLSHISAGASLSPLTREVRQPTPAQRVQHTSRLTAPITRERDPPWHCSRKQGYSPKLRASLPPQCHPPTTPPSQHSPTS